MRLIYCLWEKKLGVIISSFPNILLCYVEIPRAQHMVLRGIQCQKHFFKPASPSGVTRGEDFPGSTTPRLIDVPSFHLCTLSWRRTVINRWSPVIG